MEERVKRLLPETLPTVTILRGHHDPVYIYLCHLFLVITYSDSHNFAVHIVLHHLDFLLVIITFKASHYSENFSEKRLETT